MGDCVLWTGYVMRSGYGQIARWIDGRTVHTYAHREAWEAVHGPVPDGMHVHHACRNRACVNVEHLELVAPGEHARMEGRVAAQIAQTHCKRGHPLSGANLYEYKGKRLCRECRADAVRRRQERKRLGVGPAGDGRPGRPKGQKSYLDPAESVH